MMDSDGLVSQYYDRLMKTNNANLVLSSAFKEIFGRDLQKREWSSLGRLIKLYGKWIVLESFIRSSINPSFDNSSPWGYFNTVCMSISKDSKENLEELERIRQIKEKTKNLINDLEKSHKQIKPRKKDYLNVVK